MQTSTVKAGTIIPGGKYEVKRDMHVKFRKYEQLKPPYTALAGPNSVFIGFGETPVLAVDDMLRMFPDAAENPQGYRLITQDFVRAHIGRVVA